MKNVPRMSRPLRQMLVRLGRRSGDPHTALRFQASLGSGSATGLDAAAITVKSLAERSTSRSGRDR